MLLHCKSNSKKVEFENTQVTILNLAFVFGVFFAVFNNKRLFLQDFEKIIFEHMKTKEKRQFYKPKIYHR